MRILLLLFLFTNAVILFAMAGDVPRVSVEYIDKSTSAYTNAISAIGRIVFKNGKAAIIYEDESIEDLGKTEDINKISFSAENDIYTDNIATSLNTNNIRETNVSVFPNPVSDILHIEGIGEGQIVNLFDIKGHLIYSDTGNTVNIKDMPQGVYLLKVGSELFKIIKK